MKQYIYNSIKKKLFTLPIKKIMEKKKSLKKSYVKHTSKHIITIPR